MKEIEERTGGDMVATGPDERDAPATEMQEQSSGVGPDANGEESPGAPEPGKLDEIKASLKKIPRSPGVYLMKDSEGGVLYVGKAKELRARVRTYFRKSGDTRPRIKHLLARVHAIETFVTDTEKEALLLENNLIKEHRPRYNVTFRDDKTFVHAVIDTNHPCPRVQIVRRPKPREGILIFGPYASKQALTEMLDAVFRLFPLRSCGEAKFGRRSRPCLNYQMERCLGPCVGLVDVDAYREMVEGVVMILRGKSARLMEMLETRMQAASERLEYEKAAAYRDRIASVRGLLEAQKVCSSRFLDQDIFAVASASGRTVVSVLTVREGKLLRHSTFPVAGKGLSEVEALGSIVKQFYRPDQLIPEEVLLPDEIEDQGLVAELLSDWRGRKVRITVPRRGEKARLVELAKKNALLDLERARERSAGADALLRRVQQRLHLRHLPRRIECFDISNLRGEEATAAMAVFVDGEPDKGSYRKFKIRQAGKEDDYAMMEEVLGRRYRRAREDGDLPDLVLIDGGKGQLNVGRAVLRELGLSDLDLASIAKDRRERRIPPRAGGARRQDSSTEGDSGESEGSVEPSAREGGPAGAADRVYLPDRKDAIRFSPRSPVLRLLQRVRDESHRFAVGYHHLLRSKGLEESVLDGIPGIGSGRKAALLKEFGSAGAVAAASIEELERSRTLGPALACRVYGHLRDHGADQTE